MTNKPFVDEVLEVVTEETESGLLSRVEAQTEVRRAEPARALQPGVVIGTYQGRNAGGEPLVDFPSNPAGAAVAARAAVPLAAGDAGRDVVLVFEGGDPARPIVIGLVQPAQAVELQDGTPATDVRVDGERVTIEAEKEVVLRCGEASITLTRAGKVLIRGKYVLSRSSGANRIKGASVDVN